jgi:hypothetical protein
MIQLGQKYNSLTIISQTKKRGKVIASCDCGTIKEYYFDNIKRNKSKSCGCLLRRIKKEKTNKELSNLVNRQFGGLIIIKIIVNQNIRLRKVTARCECGTIKDYFLGNILSGKTNSCGCRNRLSSADRFRKYNKSRPLKNNTNGLSEHPIYNVWSGMISRCYDLNDISYCRYGAKGVLVCDEWKHDFKAFFDWALSNGWRAGLQIDKDINGNGRLYSPDTCCFVTRTINCRHRTTNRFIEYNGERKTLAEWSEIKKLKSSCINHRLSNGWSIKDTLETPAKNNGHHANIR